MNRKIILAENVQEQGKLAARLMGEQARQAIAERGRFTLALSGGSAVRAPYELLASETGIDWNKVFFFWGDDRFVEPSNPYSNYRLSEEALLNRLPDLRRENVFPIPADAPDPTEGARRYAETIRQFFGLEKGEWPRFDLMQNGMGPDGHTASLFPHSEALEAHEEIAVMSHARLTPWVDRVTMTLPVFNAARCVLFLASGAPKAGILKHVLEEEPNFSDYPSSAVRPTDGELIWIIEPEIAAELKRTDFEPITQTS